MARPTEVPADAFVASSASMDKPDERERMIALIESRCAELKKIAWKQRELFSTFTTLHDSARRSMTTGETFDLDALLAAKTAADMGEADIYRLRDEIIDLSTAWNRGKNLADRIAVTYTEDGIPFRVNRQRRVPAWGL